MRALTLLTVLIVLALPAPGRAQQAPAVPQSRAEITLSFAPLVKQVASAWHKVVRLSLPNGWLAETNRRNLVPQLRRLVRG